MHSMVRVQKIIYRLVLLGLNNCSVVSCLIESYLSISISDSGSHWLSAIVTSSLEHVHRDSVIKPLFLCWLHHHTRLSALSLRHFLQLGLVGSFLLRALLVRLL